MTNMLQGAITWALELTAAGLIIQYWTSSISIGVWIAVFWVVFTAVNFVPVKLYGEMEYWFVSIKVVTIIGFLIFAVCTKLPTPLNTSWSRWAMSELPCALGIAQHTRYALGTRLLKFY